MAKQFHVTKLGPRSVFRSHKDEAEYYKGQCDKLCVAVVKFLRAVDVATEELRDDMRRVMEKPK